MNKIPTKTFFHLVQKEKKARLTRWWYTLASSACTLRVCGFDFFYNNINHRLL